MALFYDLHDSSAFICRHLFQGKDISQQCHRAKMEDLGVLRLPQQPGRWQLRYLIEIEAKPFQVAPGQYLVIPLLADMLDVAVKGLSVSRGNHARGECQKPGRMADIVKGLRKKLRVCLFSYHGKLAAA